MKIIGALAAMSLLMWGQDAVPKVVLKVIQLKYASPSSIYKVVSAFQPNAMQYDDSLHVISVRGNAEMVSAIEEAVKKLDVLPADFELTVYLISSSPQTGDLLPEALNATAKQLHGVFAY